MNDLKNLPDAILSIAMTYLETVGGELRIRDRDNLAALVRHLGDDFPKLRGLLELKSSAGRLSV